MGRADYEGVGGAGWSAENLDSLVVFSEGAKVHSISANVVQDLQVTVVA